MYLQISIKMLEYYRLFNLNTATPINIATLMRHKDTLFFFISFDSTKINEGRNDKIKKIERFMKYQSHCFLANMSRRYVPLHDTDNLHSLQR